MNPIGLRYCRTACRVLLPSIRMADRIPVYRDRCFRRHPMFRPYRPWTMVRKAYRRKPGLVTKSTCISDDSPFRTHNPYRRCTVWHPHFRQYRRLIAPHPYSAGGSHPSLLNDPVERMRRLRLQAPRRPIVTDASFVWSFDPLFYALKGFDSP